jgi:group I intron endonuclease
MGYIYKITNEINNKCYIGQTIRSPAERWRVHRSEGFNKNCVKYEYPLYRAFRKYGIGNFSFSVIEENENDILTNREIYWTNYYNSVDNGYNQQYGTLYKDSSYKYVDKDLILKLFKENKSIMDINNITSYSKDIIRGVLHSSGYTKEDIEKNGIMVRTGKIKKPVNQYDLNYNFIQNFSSITEASNQTGVNGSHISGVCKNSRKTAGGFIWSYC